MSVVQIVLVSVGAWLVGALFTSRSWWIHALRKVEAKGEVPTGDWFYVDGDYDQRRNKMRPATMRDLYYDPTGPWRAFYVGVFWPFFLTGLAIWWFFSRSSNLVWKPLGRAIKWAAVAFYSDPKKPRPPLLGKPSVSEKAA